MDTGELERRTQADPIVAAAPAAALSVPQPGHPSRPRPVLGRRLCRRGDRFERNCFERDREKALLIEQPQGITAILGLERALNRHTVRFTGLVLKSRHGVSGAPFSSHRSW